jgi:hypothetical protein
MGQYFKVVNVKKRQYLDPHMFGDGLKLMEFAPSGGGTMAALAVLLADGNGRRGGGGGDLNSNNPIVGSWAGDPIVIAGDYADEGKFLPADKNEFNLYHVADDEGTDISAKVLDALLEDRYFAEEFIKNWSEHKNKDSYYRDTNLVVNKWRLHYNQQSVPTANHHSVKACYGHTYDVVDLNDGTDVWTCTCPAYQYNKVPGTDCKHIKEVKTKLATV